MEKDKRDILSSLFVIRISDYENDYECYKRPVRYIRSMEKADEPLTLAQVSALPYENPVLYRSKLEAPTPIVLN